jgi:hypothetical protein
VVDTPDQVLVHIVQDLIDFSLTKIEHPLNLIPEMPVDNVSEPDDFSEEEGFNLERSVLGYEDMEDHNDHDEERGNPPQKINLGCTYILWPSLDEYITFPNTEKSYFLNLTLRL